MSAISPLGVNPSTSSTSASTNNAVQSSIAAATGLTSSQFMQLLVSQVQNQDPLNPMSDADFAAQLAQFASLEGIDQMNTNLSSLLTVQQLAQGASLIGHTVDYQPTAGSTTTSQGTVDQIAIQNGQLQLIIGGKAVNISQVSGIQPSATASSTAAGS